MGTGIGCQGKNNTLNTTRNIAKRTNQAADCHVGLQNYAFPGLI